MLITQEMLIEYAKIVTEDKALLAEREENKKRYLMYHGATKVVVEKAIRKEFKKQETINELISRLVPLNIMAKVINKLAGVYKEAPIRSVSSKDERETEILNLLEDGMSLNIIMKEANRYFKMNKKALVEIYLDDFGVPSLRVLPAHTYEVFSVNTKKKSIPNMVIKIDEVNERLIFWSDESYFETDYSGTILKEKMRSMENEEGENPFDILPFEFINESSTSVNPIQDDDLLSVSTAIPVLLTDLLFGLKFQCWAIIWTIGKVGDIPFNPNSVIEMDFGEDGQRPEINTVKPDLDSDKMLSVIMALVSLILSTKNLQAGSITDGITVQNAASGIAKMMDSAESVEDKKDQQAFFYKAEQGIFSKLREMMKVWKQWNELNEVYDFELPEDFSVNITFQDPRALMTESEQIDTSKKKLEAGLTTLKRELQKLNPDLDDEAIQVLYKEIMEEQSLRQALLDKAKTDLEVNTNGV